MNKYQGEGSFTEFSQRPDEIKQPCTCCRMQEDPVECGPHQGADPKGRSNNQEDLDPGGR